MHCVEGPTGAVDTTEEIIGVATQYYKDLFKYEERPDVRLHSNFFSETDKLTEREIIELENNFTEEEIKRAIFESYSDGAPALMGCLLYSTRNSGL
jgi:hypothetical protein